MASSPGTTRDDPAAKEPLGGGSSLNHDNPGAEGSSVSSIAQKQSLSELRDLDQWVGWRYENRDGTAPTKILYDPKALSRKASSTDRSTWASFQLAMSKLTAAAAHPLVKSLDGVGFVFTADDPYVGLDLDHCVVDGVVHPAAQAIIDKLASWWELSPSGTGVHVIVRGHLPDGVGNRGIGEWGGSIEVYEQGRYFTMNGGGQGEIAERSEQLAELAAQYLSRATAPVERGDWDYPGTDDELIDELRGDPWAREMFDGTKRPADWSTADFGLVSRIAELTGDPVRIERVWAASALSKRDKFERADYRQRTIHGGLGAATANRESDAPAVDSPLGGRGRESERVVDEIDPPTSESPEVDSLSPAPRGESEKVDPKLALRVAMLRRDEEARDILRRERDAKRLKLPPKRESYTLTSYQAEPRRVVVDRIRCLQRVGHRAVLGAQWKTGKSTLSADLAAALADHRPFVDEFEVAPLDGRVGIFNAEMDDYDQREYLDNTHVRNTDGIAVWNLRGFAIDLLSDAGRDAAIEWLRDNRVRYWVLDPWADICTWSGVSVNDNEEVAPLLLRVDQVAKDAGVGELLVVHHAGWDGTRLKGATRLPEWADSVWQYEADTQGNRMLNVRGRGVGVQGTVRLDPDTGVLSFKHATAKEVRFDDAVRLAVEFVRHHPGTGKTAVYAVLPISSSAQAAVLDEALRTGLLIDQTPDGRTSSLIVNPNPPRKAGPKPAI